MKRAFLVILLILVFLLLVFAALRAWDDSVIDDTPEATEGSEELTSQAPEPTMVERTIESLPDTGGPK